MGTFVSRVKSPLGQMPESTDVQHQENTQNVVRPGYSTTSGVTLEDVFDLIGSMNNDMSNRLMQLEVKVDNILSRLEKLESHNVLLTSAIAIDPTLRGNAIREVNVGRYTSSVMNMIPAGLTFALWRFYHPDRPIPVSYDYLVKLFKNICEDYAVSIRRELGSIFSVVMDSKGDVKPAVYMTLLSDTTCVHSTVMRSNILRLWGLLCTTHAPFIPLELHNFIEKFTGIANNGEIVYSEAVNKTARGKFVQPGVVYDVMGPDWLMKSEVMKIIQQADKSTNYMQNVVKSLSKGNIPTNEQLGGFRMKPQVDMIDTLTRTSISKNKRSSNRDSIDLDNMFGD